MTKAYPLPSLEILCFTFLFTLTTLKWANPQNLWTDYQLQESLSLIPYTFTFFFFLSFTLFLYPKGSLSLQKGLSFSFSSRLCLCLSVSLFVCVWEFLRWLRLWFRWILCHWGSDSVQLTRSWSTTTWGWRSMGMKKMSLLFVKLMSVNASLGSCLVSFLFFSYSTVDHEPKSLCFYYVFCWILHFYELGCYWNWEFCVLFGSILDMLQIFFLDFGWRRLLFYYVIVCDWISFCFCALNWWGNRN